MCTASAVVVSSFLKHISEDSTISRSCVSPRLFTCDAASVKYYAQRYASAEWLIVRRTCIESSRYRSKRLYMQSLKFFCDTYTSVVYPIMLQKKFCLLFNIFIILLYCRNWTSLLGHIACVYMFIVLIILESNGTSTAYLH